MENDKIKTPRASQSREQDKRPTTWTPPSSLDAPPAPDGFRHRWIRTEVLGFDDTKNMSGKMRSGWELVRADEYPDASYPQLKDGKYAGVISGAGGDFPISNLRGYRSGLGIGSSLRLRLGNSKIRLSC